MIYATIDTTPDAQKFEQPAAEGFYERIYHGGDDPEWIKDYWDGERWFYTKGGKVAITQKREWRVIQSKEGG